MRRYRHVPASRPAGVRSIVSLASGVRPHHQGRRHPARVGQVGRENAFGEPLDEC
jgi:hypothetical protein